jgi:hypothetical protein
MGDSEGVVSYPKKKTKEEDPTALSLGQYALPISLG